MTTLAVLQPSYLPWLGYFDQIDRADIFVVYDDVQFDKHGWRNRNRIKGPAGPLWMTVPVRHKGRFRQAINAVEIDNAQLWARRHVRTLQQCYARAPFAANYLPEFENLLNRGWQRLADLDIAVTGALCGWLGVAAEWHLSSELNVTGDRNSRLLALCRHFGVTTYLTGNAAQSYLDVPRFQAENIAVVWQDYGHPGYSQQFGEFVPYLSTIDLLLNVGEGSLAVIRQGRRLDRFRAG